MAGRDKVLYNSTVVSLDVGLQLPERRGTLHIPHVSHMYGGESAAHAKSHSALGEPSR